MALCAAHAFQLCGVHLFDHRARLLGQRRVVRRHLGRKPLGKQHRIHARAAPKQLGNGVFAVNQRFFLLFHIPLLTACGASPRKPGAPGL